MSFQQKRTFLQIRKYLETIEENEFDKVRKSSDKLINEIEKTKSSLREDVKTALSEVRLNLNLEKGRMKDAATSRNTNIHENETKILNEVDILHKEINDMKIQTNQWFTGFVGVVSSVVLIILFYF